MVTILTALRGNPVLSSRWLRAAANCGIDLRIIAAVNNDADDVALKAIEGAVAIPVTLFEADDETARINHVANIYRELIVATETDLAILWDDDVLPPFKGVTRLTEAMKQAGQDVAGITSVCPIKDFPEASTIFWKESSLQSLPMSAMPVSGLHQVWGGGNDFSIWRTRVLQQTIPWRSGDREGTIEGCDMDLARKLRDLKLRTLVDCSIHCRHDNLPR